MLAAVISLLCLSVRCHYGGDRDCILGLRWNIMCLCEIDCEARFNMWSPERRGRGGGPPRHRRGMEILIYFVGYGSVWRNKEEEEKGTGWDGVENAEA